MSQSEEKLLYADPFTPADLPFLAGLHCGDEAWARAATEWIRGSEVIDSIENHETKVWIYRHSEADDSIVGFASLSATGWMKWPPPNGKRSRLLYIPQLGLDHKYRGKPSSPEYRYSNQIIEHLIGQAKNAAKQIRGDKSPKKHVELLTLRVHRNNIPAQRLYQRYGFEFLPAFEENDHLVMHHKLALDH
ncbi:hypothetical protein Enr13x_20610 [Stieleria neptunia]|uniref:N-acetyltransferase domain-containing protein n=1 Tax=Stieleria neptunia TaxID=2527979 RepID=A0A518HMZ2_9BACT|nr:GNAT family N-acetyltransferase [Stieleria neptunia]QDV42216.1 hypothetical protein Enr13x_20610 [Stieleria neptunia]